MTIGVSRHALAIILVIGNNEVEGELPFNYLTMVALIPLTVAGRVWLLISRKCVRDFHLLDLSDYNIINRI